MKLLDKLAATPPSEDGGASATRGLAYQQDWTLCLILKLHNSDDDYVVLCDYHDDVVVVRPKTPASFFQVKSYKSKRWTLKSFMKPEKRKGKSDLPSCAAKLYQHRLDFDGDCGELTFISNLRFTAFKLRSEPKCQSRDTFTAADLTDEALAELRGALQAQLGLKAPPNVAELIAFEVSDLNYESHRETTIGKLDNYFSERLPGRALPIRPIYLALRDEILRKTKHSSTYDSGAELSDLKGMSRDFVEQAMTEFVGKAGTDPQQVMAAIKSELASAPLGFLPRRRLEQAVERYGFERMGDPDSRLVQAQAAVIDAIDSLGPEADAIATLWEMMQLVLQRLPSDIGLPDNERLAVIAWECHEHEPELPQADAVTEEETG